MVRSLCACVCLMCVYEYTDLLALCLLGAQHCSTRLHCLIWRASVHTTRSDRATQHAHTPEMEYSKSTGFCASEKAICRCIGLSPARGVLLCAHIMFLLNRIIGNIDAQKNGMPHNRIDDWRSDTFAGYYESSFGHYTRAEHAIIAHDRCFVSEHKHMAAEQ